MVEHKESFSEEEASEVESVSVATELHSNQGNHHQATQDTPSIIDQGGQNKTSSVQGQFDDATSDPGVSFRSREKMEQADHVHLDVDIGAALLSFSTLTHTSQEGSGGNRGAGNSRFDDATEESSISANDANINPAPEPNPQQPAQSVWSDHQVETILVGSVLTEEPQNVLELRRQWPTPPIPDTRQLNRILYKLRDEGKIRQCPPNGTNQKPCWEKVGA